MSVGPLSHLPRGLGIGLRRQNDELLAAVPCHRVGDAKTCTNGAGETLQDLIAREVTILIVIFF